MTSVTPRTNAALEAARRAAEEAARRAREAAKAREAARKAAEAARQAKQEKAPTHAVDHLEARAGRALETAESRTEAAVGAADRARTTVGRAQGRVSPFSPDEPLLDGFEANDPALQRLDRLGVRVDSLADRERAADVGLDAQRARRDDLSPAARVDLRLDAEARLRSLPSYRALDDEGSRRDFAVAVEAEVQRLPADQAARLVDELSPQLTEVARSAHGTPPEEVRRSIIDSFSAIAERTGPAGARALARDFASVAIDDHTDVDDTDQLGGALKASITGGQGAAFAAALTQELSRTNPGTDLAGNVAKATREGIRDVREDFDERTARYASLDQGLQATVEVLGPNATQAEQQEAVQRFLHDNREAYDAFETESARLTTVLDGAAMLANEPAAPEELRSEGAEALSRLELAGNSQAGQAKLREAVAESRHRESVSNSFLDDVAAASKGGSIAREAVGLTDKLAQVRVIAAGQVTKVVGNEAVLAGLAGNSSRADALMGQLEGMHALYGLSPEKQAEVMSGINGIMRDRPSPEATARRLDALVGPNGTAATSADYGLRALRNLGTVAGLPGIIAADYGSDELATRAQAYASAVGFGADTLAMTTDLLGRGQKAPGLGAALGKLSAVTGLVTGGVDGYQGIQKVLGGDLSEGGPQLLTGVGGLTAGAATLAPLFSTAAAAQVVPVAGQIAGAALVLGGVVWAGINAGKAESEAEQSWQSLYESLGVDRETAERLAQADDNDGRSVMPLLLGLRDSLGTDRREFARWVQQMDPSTAEFLARVSRDVPGGRLTPEQLEALKGVGAVPGGGELRGIRFDRGTPEEAQLVAEQNDAWVAIGSWVVGP